MTDEVSDLGSQLYSYLKAGDNVLFFQEELYDLYKLKMVNDMWAFVADPRKGKAALEIVISTLSEGHITKNLSAAVLLEIIRGIQEEEYIVIFVNNFEYMNRRNIEYYKELIGMSHVQLVGNIVDDSHEFIDPKFLEKFVILGSEDFGSARSNSVNVKYPMLLLLSVFIFLLFVRLQLSVVSFLVSALWFTLLMYRSFFYITK